MTHIKPEISVIIPVKNGAQTIEKCIESVLAQQGPTFEVIIVDNFSPDITPDICKKYADKIQFFQKGPERHAQRRFGAEKAQGNFLFFIDADMWLENGVLKEAYELCTQQNAAAVIIPETPFGALNFWTRCKIRERSMYAGDDAIEAARFFNKEAYTSVGGFDTNMISFEDWDLTRKMRSKNKTIKRTMHTIYHDEGYVTLSNIFSKKKYYGSKATDFQEAHGFWSIFKKIYFFRSSFWRFLPKSMRQNKTETFGMIYLLGVELLAGAIGFCLPKKS
jgi:glycosyltransferase involved in cell wall biosynthesis